MDGVPLGKARAAGARPFHDRQNAKVSFAAAKSRPARFPCSFRVFRGFSGLRVARGSAGVRQRGRRRRCRGESARRGEDQRAGGAHVVPQRPNKDLDGHQL